MVVFKIGHLVPRLSRICRIHWECSFFVCQARDALNGQMWSKNQNFQLKVNICKRSNEEFDVFLLRPKPKIFVGGECICSIISKSSVVICKQHYSEFNSVVCFFCSWLEILLLRKFGTKVPNFCLSRKAGVW